jgi:hypothetical protein
VGGEVNSNPVVKDVLVENPADGITVVKADGRVVYSGADPIIINAWTRAALEGVCFQDLLVRAMREPPLLMCVDCKNTESPAGAMARQFNHGRCMYCGGTFTVVRA